MRVLYVNQTGAMSGAERSLLTLLDALDGRFEARVVAPGGPLSAALDARGVPHGSIRGTEASFRLHPLQTPVGLSEMVASAAAVAREARRGRADVVHANTTRAGLIAVLASAFGAPRPVVHIRDWVPEGRVPEVTLKLIARGAAAVVANSSWSAGQFAAVGADAPVDVLHNPIDLARFDPDAVDRGAARAALGLEPGDVVLGVVGQLTPWKGQRDALEAFAKVAERHPRALLLIAGSAKFAAASTRFDNRAYEAELRDRIDRLGLATRVRMLGEQSDVPSVMRALDVLLVPSWREAFGRVAAEGLALGLPVLASRAGGLVEIVDDGVTGLVLEPQNVRAWAGALDRICSDSGLRARLGGAGRAVARERFSPQAHADEMLALYRRVAASG